MDDVKKIAQGTIEALQAEGAEKAQCTALVSEKREFNVDGGEFSLFRTLFDKSLSLMAIKGHKKGNIAINRFDDEAVAAAVKDCIAVAESASEDEAWDIAPKQEDRKVVQGAPEADVDLLFSRTKELLKDINERFPKIIVEQMIVSHEKTNKVYCNTSGSVFDVTDGVYEVSVMFSGHEGEVASSFFGSGVITADLDTPFIELGTLKKDLADVEQQIHQKPFEGKFTGTILLTPGCLGSFISSIVSNFASDGVLLDGTSLWKNKLDTKVADERITIHIRPEDDRIVCPEVYTNEGFLSEGYDLIQKGVLKQFKLSLYVANKTGHPRAKNSAFSCVIEPGDTSYEDMVKNIKKGIIVGRFSGGNPGTNGEFSGVAKNSFLVEDGKITGAISETMINGNLADILNNLVAISKETVCDGMDVLPYMAFDGIVISGK